MKNEDSRNSLNTSLANYSSPKHARPRISSTLNDSRHLNTSQGSVQAYENGYSKAVTKFRKTHRHTNSMTKMDSVNTSVPKEVVIDILKNPKFLPSLSVKKNRRKFENVYEDSKKRLARKLQNELEHEEHEQEKSRNAILKEDVEESQKITIKSPEVRSEQAPLFSKNFKRFLKPKAPFRVTTNENNSLNDLPDNSFSRSTRQMGMKIFSLNAFETPKTKTQTRDSFRETEQSQNQTQNLQVRRSISNSITQDRKRITQSVIESLPEPFVKKDEESAEKPSSTLRFHNRLKKILEVKDNNESTTKQYTKFKAFQPSTEYGMVNTQVLGSTKRLGLKKFKDL